MAYESVLDYKKLSVKKIDHPDDEIISLLKNTIQGSEGGMRYSVQNTEEKVKALGDSLSFLALYRRNSLAGVIGLCSRDTYTCGVKYASTFVRYLAMQSTYQTVKAPEGKRERLSFTEESFKQKILDLFKGPQQDEKEAGDSVLPHVMYAYVESRNERSKNLIHQAGYEYIRSFLTVAFSRFNPLTNPSVARLLPEEEPAMASLLAEQYHNYAFYYDDFSFYDHKYYVMRRNGTIVAGVNVIPALYRIVNVPGLWGWIMMKLLPVTPFFRRLFKPDEFRYLVLNAIYCPKGNEDLLPDLFEAVCAEEGYHTALTWLDDHSELYESVRTNRRMGAINRMLNAKPGLIYASFSGLTEKEKEKFYECPAYISGFDFS
jgi:hypothetical protein